MKKIIQNGKKVLLHNKNLLKTLFHFNLNNNSN